MGVFEDYSGTKEGKTQVRIEKTKGAGVRGLFESHNLIGDGLCVSAALRVWHREHPVFEIDLLTDNNAVAELYKGMGVPLRVVFQVSEIFGKKVVGVGDIEKQAIGLSAAVVGHYDFEFNFDVSKAFAICDEKKCHLAQGYAHLLGVRLGPEATDLGPFYDPPLVAEDDALVASIPERTVLIAPFSRSCSSHTGGAPNKCLPWAKWKPILRFLRAEGCTLRVTGSPDDRADELGFSEDEYLTGFPLRPLARAMKEGRIRMLVSVDNGLSHLAGSQKIPQILFYPLCLGLHYAVPWSNPFVMPVHMDPALADAAQLLWAVKQSYKMLQKMKEEDPDGLLQKRQAV